MELSFAFPVTSKASTVRQTHSYHRDGVGEQCAVLAQHVGHGDLRQVHVLRMEREQAIVVHGVTEGVVPRLHLIQVYQRVVGKGRRCDGWNVKVFTFQTWARVGLKDRSYTDSHYHPLGHYCQAQGHSGPLAIPTRSITDLAKIFKHWDHPGALCLLCMDKDASVTSSAPETSSFGLKPVSVIWLCFPRKLNSTRFQ